jgi:hypothetical protein
MAYRPVDRTVMEVFRNHLLHQVIQQTLQSAEPRSAELQVEILEGDQFQARHFQVTSFSLYPRSTAFDSLSEKPTLRINFMVPTKSSTSAVQLSTQSPVL